MLIIFSELSHAIRNDLTSMEDRVLLIGESVSKLQIELACNYQTRHSNSIATKSNKVQHKKTARSLVGFLL